MEAASDVNKGEQTMSLAAKLGNLVIVRKGQVDLITDGKNSEKFRIIFHYLKKLPLSRSD